MDIKVYQSLLTPTAELDMYNFEICIEAAYDGLKKSNHPLLPRLLRLPEPQRAFRRR